MCHPQYLACSCFSFFFLVLTFLTSYQETQVSFHVDLPVPGRRRSVRPNSVCLLFAVTGCHILVLFWGMSKPERGIDSLLSTLLRCRLNYPMKSAVPSSSDTMCVVVLTLMVVRTLPSGLTSHEVKKSYAWDINRSLSRETETMKMTF